MTRVGFEPMTPVFERTKTDYALDGAATVICMKDLSTEFTKLGMNIALFEVSSAS
jgi:hypothetical protein